MNYFENKEEIVFQKDGDSIIKEWLEMVNKYRFSHEICQNPVIESWKIPVKDSVDSLLPTNLSSSSSRSIGSNDASIGQVLKEDVSSSDMEIIQNENLYQNLTPFKTNESTSRGRRTGDTDQIYSIRGGSAPSAIVPLGEMNYNILGGQSGEHKSINAISTPGTSNYFVHNSKVSREFQPSTGDISISHRGSSLICSVDPDSGMVSVGLSKPIDFQTTVSDITKNLAEFGMKEVSKDIEQMNHIHVTSSDSILNNHQLLSEVNYKTKKDIGTIFCSNSLTEASDSFIHNEGSTIVIPSEESIIKKLHPRIYQEHEINPKSDEPYVYKAKKDWIPKWSSHYPSSKYLSDVLGSQFPFKFKFLRQHKESSQQDILCQYCFHKKWVNSERYNTHLALAHGILKIRSQAYFLPLPVTLIEKPERDFINTFSQCPICYTWIRLGFSGYEIQGPKRPEGLFENHFVHVMKCDMARNTDD